MRRRGPQPPLVLLAAVRRVRRRLARLAAERGAARGLLVGLLVAGLLLAVRDRIALPLPPLVALAAAAVGFAVAGGLGALLAALAGPATVRAAARAADRELGLADRLATALELASSGTRGVFADACIRDAARTAVTVDARRVGRRRWPREARFLPATAAAAAAAALLPPVPVERAFEAVAAVVGQSGAAGPEAAEEREPEPRRAAELPVKEALRRDVHEGPLPRSGESLRLSSAFKDTKLSRLKPDANAFLGTSDERLKLLQQPGALPDLKSQPTGGGYRLRLRRVQEALGAMGNGGISKKQFSELTDRLRKLGRERGAKGGSFDKALQDGMAAFEAGDEASAYESMERAIDALGGGESAGDSSLAPSSEGGGPWPDELASLPPSTGGEDGAQGPDGGHGQEGSPGSRGSEAGAGGRGKKRRAGQQPPDWAARNDSFVEGTASQGESEAYDSDVVGRAGRGKSRLPYMNVFNEYRKQVEETLVKEAVPLESREHVRAYFRSLEE